MLIAAAGASMAGNIAAAWRHHDSATAAVAIAAAAIPPLALLTLTHLAAMWSRIRTRGIVYRCFLAAVAAIAAAAFRLSFAALRELAVSYGYGAADAALFPLILDGLVAVCTLGLVVLARIEAGDAHRDAHEAGRDTAGESGDADDSSGEAVGDSAPLHAGSELVASAGVEKAPGRSDSRLVAAGAAPTSGDSAIASRDAWWRIGHCDSDAHRRIAHRLVDAGRTTLGADAVQEVLDRTASGESGRAVAALLGLSPSAVQRVLKAARDEQVPATH